MPHMMYIKVAFYGALDKNFLSSVIVLVNLVKAYDEHPQNVVLMPR